MEYGCIAGTGRAVIVYLLFAIKFVGRPEEAFFSSAVSYSPVSLYQGTSCEAAVNTALSHAAVGSTSNY